MTVQEHVTCEECGESFPIITWAHLRSLHQMTTKEYLDRHPGSSLASESTRIKHQESMKRPEIRAKVSRAMKGAWARRSPEDKERLSLKRRAIWQDPEFRAKACASARMASKKRWQDPEYRRKCLTAMNSRSRGLSPAPTENPTKKPPTATEVVWARFNLPEGKSKMMCALLRHPIPPSDGQDIIFACDDGRLIRRPAGTMPRTEVHANSPESVEPTLRSYAESIGGAIQSLKFRRWK